MPREGGASTLSDSCESLSLVSASGRGSVHSISIAADSRGRASGAQPEVTGLRLHSRAAALRQRDEADHLDAFADRQHERSPGMDGARRAGDAASVEPDMPRGDHCLRGAARARDEGIIRHLKACDRMDVNPETSAVREIIDDALNGRRVFAETQEQTRAA